MVIMMERYESQDWEAWCMQCKEREAAELMKRSSIPGDGACAGLAAAASPGPSAAAPVTHPTTPTPLFSGGAHPPVALPRSASDNQNSPSAALIEASRQQALANRAHQEAVLKEKYQRDMQALDAANLMR